MWLRKREVMVFSSSVFLYCFLPITLIFYFCIPKAKNMVLLICSLIFFFLGEPRAHLDSSVFDYY